MARINTYNIDNTIDPLDKVIGTDANDNSKTKNFTIADLNDYFSLNPPPGGFIPLSGTTEGNPVTGNIEVANNVFIYNGALPNNAIYFIMRNGNEGGFAKSSSSGGTSISFDKTDNDLYVKSTVPNSKGLKGGSYFGANYDDNTYVQKKYVDDAIAENSPIVREKITITGSAFRTLNSSPVTLIPAPGAGKLIVLTSIVTFFDFGSVQANYASGAYSITGLSGSGTIGNLNFGSDIVLFISQEDLNNNIAINQAIILSNTVGDATVGDSTLNVYVTYEIITL